MENLQESEFNQESQDLNKSIKSSASEDKSITTVTSLYNLMSCLKREIKKLDIAKQQASQIEDLQNKKINDKIFHTTQAHLDLIQEQGRLLPLNSSEGLGLAQHISNPNHPHCPRTMPRPILEYGKQVFKDGTYDPIQELLFLIRENPQISSQILEKILNGASNSYSSDDQLLQFITLFFFDNPFVDSSVTKDSNISNINLLKSIHYLLKKENTLSQISNYQQENNWSKKIFKELIKQIECQSFMRFLFKNIISKVYLSEIETFINEANKKISQELNQKRDAELISKKQNIPNISSECTPQIEKKKQKGFIKSILNFKNKCNKQDKRTNNFSQSTILKPLNNSSQDLLASRKQSTLSQDSDQFTQHSEVSHQSTIKAKTLQRIEEAKNEEDQEDGLLKTIEQVETDEISRKMLNGTNFKDLIQTRVSRMDLIPGIQQNIKQLLKNQDFTDYLLLVVQKLIEVVLKQADQIPLTIRLYLKMVIEDAQQENSKITYIEISNIVNDLLITNWLSYSLQIPEYFGILPKPRSFNETHKQIFFHTAQKVFQYSFIMEEKIKLSDQQMLYFDTDKINKFIDFQKTNILIFTEEVLDISTDIIEKYEPQRGIVEYLTLRLDDTKFLLRLISINRNKLIQTEPYLSEILERLEMRCSLESILDENYGLIRADSMLVVDEDHFNQNYDDSTKFNSEFDEFLKQQKFLLFTQIRQNNPYKHKKHIQKMQDKETYIFIQKHQFKDEQVVKMIMRNLQELVQFKEVSFPSKFKLMNNCDEFNDQNLSAILYYLIKNDEFCSYSRSEQERDQLKTQCFIINKNLAKSNISNNSSLQYRILKHLIKLVNIEKHYYEQDILILDQKYSYHTQNNTKKYQPTTFIPNRIGIESLQYFFNSFEDDLNQYQKLIENEKQHCDKIQQGLEISNQLSSMRPQVCLEYDPQYGFKIIKTDECHIHQVNPLLTGQLFFGPLTTQGNQRQKQDTSQTKSQRSSSKTNHEQNKQSYIDNRKQNHKHFQSMIDIQQTSLLTSGNVLDKDKYRHYYIKKIDYFVMSFINKYRRQFNTLLSMKGLGQLAKEIDFMNLRKTYFDFLEVIKQELESSQLEYALVDINEYIMRQFHRQIFLYKGESPLDTMIRRKLESDQFSMEALDFPQELQDEELWNDTISTFDKFASSETPIEKLSVLLRTIRMSSSIFQMASLKSNQIMTADDEFMMLLYIIKQSQCSQKLYSNYLFVKLFKVEQTVGEPLDKVLATLDAVIQYILNQQEQNESQ